MTGDLLPTIALLIFGSALLLGADAYWQRRNRR